MSAVNNEKTYVGKNEIESEITMFSIFIGIILSVVFGAANAYLGLRVGMTISASIPAAVIAMAVMSFICGRKSILESNMVQTIGSAGESLAAGAAFTLPALFLWEGKGIENPSVFFIFLISFFSGILGVLFMIPLRRSLMVKEDSTLLYPEGRACANVLLAGQEKGASAKSIFAGLIFSSAFKFIVEGLRVVSGMISLQLKSLKTELSMEIYPSLIGVGYICGLRTSCLIASGGILAWLILIPLIVFFGANSTIPVFGSKTISEIYEGSGAWGIWSNYIRYIGAGAVAVGGLVSLIKTLPLIFNTFFSLSEKKIKDVEKKDQDLNLKLVGWLIFIVAIAICLLPQFNISFLGCLLILLFGFFFAVVSSKAVGLIGSTNNPISGMTIATLIIVSGVLKWKGIVGVSGLKTAIVIGSIVCIIAAISGDTSQDLKTGFLLGATPKKQQIGEIIGVFASSLSIGIVLIILNKAWGFGSNEIRAPQASLMKMIVEGGLEGNLPWFLIFIGGFISLIFEMCGLSSISVGIGVYLPLSVSFPLVFGGIVRFLSNKYLNNKNKKLQFDNGTLFCSGIIAGEGLIGFLLAIFAVLNIDLDVSKYFSVGTIGGFISLAIILLFIFYFSIIGSKSVKEENGKKGKKF